MTTMHRHVQQAAPRSVWRDHAIWLILAVGAGFVIRQYVFNRALWLDEAMLALNIIERSAAALFGPLDMNQAAPVGFLLAEKAAVTVLGPEDYALRLFPLLSSLGALFVAVAVGARTTPRVGILMLLGLIGSNAKVIHFANETKQYSTDMLVALILVLLALRAREASLHRSDLVALAGVGALALWFSHPAVFVLAGIGLYLLRLQIVKDRTRIWRLIPVALPWVASLAVLYLVSLSQTSGNARLQGFWQAYFMPLPPTSLDDVRWFLFYPFHVFRDPMSMTFPGLTVFFAVAGCVGMATDHRRRDNLILFVSPLLFALLASGFHLYPFGLRLLLFLVPSIALLTAHGLALLWLRDDRNSKLLAASAAALLLLHPMAESLYHLGKPRMVQEIKPVLSEVERSNRPGDRLYVHRGAGPAFRFYADRYGLDALSTTFESTECQGVKCLLRWYEKLPPGSRGWVFFTHFEPGRDQQIMAEYIQVAQTRGQVVSDYTATGARAVGFEVTR